MPFKSASQRRLFYAMANRGEISKATVKRWEKHTPKGKKLPEHVRRTLGGRVRRKKRGKLRRGMMRNALRGGG